MKKSYVIIGIMSCIMLAGCQNTTAAEQAVTNLESKNTDLEIPIDDLSETPSFYPIAINGTNMEIIAGKAKDGTVRTAFNTCQVCYDSGHGYYELDGNNLVCQNCGNTFGINQVGIESGGCNPWPISHSDRIIEDRNIKISGDFLIQSQEIFENWGK